MLMRDKLNRVMFPLSFNFIVKVLWKTMVNKTIFIFPQKTISILVAHISQIK